MKLIDRLAEWAERRLVPEWRESWKWASVQFAAAFSTLIGALIANPDALLSFLPILPSGPWRVLLIVLFMLASFVLPTLLRLWKQERCDDE